MSNEVGAIIAVVVAVLVAGPILAWGMIFVLRGVIGFLKWGGRQR